MTCNTQARRPAATQRLAYGRFSFRTLGPSRPLGGPVRPASGLIDPRGTLGPSRPYAARSGPPRASWRVQAATGLGSAGPTWAPRPYAARYGPTSGPPDPRPVQALRGPLRASCALLGTSLGLSATGLGPSPATIEQPFSGQLDSTRRNHGSVNLPG